MQSLPDLCSESLLPHSVIQKWNRVENRHHLQNSLMQLFLYLVHFGLVSLLAVCCWIVMAGSRSPDRGLPLCTDSLYASNQCRLSLNASWLCAESPCLVHSEPAWVQDIDVVRAGQHRWSIYWDVSVPCKKQESFYGSCEFLHKRTKEEWATNSNHILSSQLEMCISPILEERSF